jgi:hypothetical protein
MGYWEFLVRVVSLSRPILLALVLAALLLFGLRALGIEPFVSIDRGLYLTLVAAGLVCGCIVLVDITPRIIRSIRGSVSRCRSYFARRRRALRAMGHLTSEFKDILGYLKRENIRWFEIPGRPGTFYEMEQECLLDRYSPAYAREGRTNYRVPRYVWRRIAVGGSTQPRPPYQIVPHER